MQESIGNARSGSVKTDDVTAHWANLDSRHDLQPSVRVTEDRTQISGA